MNDEQEHDGKKSKENYLWHFTSCEALPKILLGEDGLLAGSTVFMDDTTDSYMSRELLKATIPLHNAMIQAMGSKTLSVQEKLYSSGMLLPTFAVSFTSEIQQAMWQVYTKTGGVAIGFDPKALVDAVKSQTDDCFDVLVKECDYMPFTDMSDTIVKLGQFIKQKVAQIAAGDKFGSLGKLNALAIKCAERSRLYVFKKRECFGWEKEFRIAYVCKDDRNLCNRLRFCNGKPFVTMQLPDGKRIRDYVRKISISPFGDMAKTRTIALLLGEAIGLEAENIIDGDLA